MSLVEGANPTSKFTWTDDAVTTLHRLVDDKYSAQQIATVLGTTRNAVLGKCFRLNISTNPVPENAPTA